MVSDIDEALVTALARAMVARAAPAELPAFRVVSKGYFADPARSLTGEGGGGRGPLEIGETATALLLTPVALAAAAPRLWWT